jgi:hypothetical protein
MSTAVAGKEVEWRQDEHKNGMEKEYGRKAGEF